MVEGRESSLELGGGFLGALAGAGRGEARAPTSGVAFTQLLLASVLSDTAGLPHQGEGCRSGLALSGLLLGTAPDTGAGPRGHV